MREAGGDALLVHVAPEPVFLAAHIPGALHVSPEALVSGLPPAPGRLPPVARLNALFSSIGYTREREIIAYDDEGGGWAGRFLWTLEVIGHSRWRYLNGGIHAWAAASGALATGPAEAPPRTEVSVAINTNSIAEAEDVLAAIGADDTVIWDVRSREEYVGERVTAKRRGHIPSAVHLDWLALKDPADHQRLVPDLPGLLAAQGITPDKAVITHCHTHHRSGLSWLVARMLGYPSVRAYHGSWSEWGNRGDLPVTDGNEPG